MIRKVAVLGSGTMGAQIAGHIANAGLPVLLLDVSKDQVQAALLIRSGCERVLVGMAENLSQLTPAEDLRMLLTVGDGAACVLLERGPAAGFRAMLHGTEPALASTMAVRTPFPPAGPAPRHAHAFRAARPGPAFLRARWRAPGHESLPPSRAAPRAPACSAGLGWYPPAPRPGRASAERCSWSR